MRAELIFENGPLTRAEVKKLPNDKAFEYFQVMSAFLTELGPEALLLRHEELREAVLRKIVNRPV
jgi:hypothetical protein